MEPKCNFLTTIYVPWIVLYYFTLVFVSILWSWLTRVRDLIEIVYKAYLWEETKIVSDTTEETVNEFIGYQMLVIHIFKRSWDILKYLPDASSSGDSKAFCNHIFLFIMDSQGYLSDSRYNAISCAYELWLNYICQLYPRQIFDLYTSGICYGQWQMICRIARIKVEGLKVCRCVCTMDKKTNAKPT